MPYRSAAMNCASLQRPIPSFVSDEMFGTLNVPKAVGNASPPPRRVASSCFGTAWHDEQPPMRNIVRPLARSGLYEASTICGITGALKTQPAASASAPAESNTNAITIFFIVSPARRSHIQIEVPARPCHAGTFARSRSPLLARQAIILVAGVARICDHRNGGAQAVYRTLGLVAILGDEFPQRGRLGIEVCLRHPDLRRRARLLAAL